METIWMRRGGWRVIPSTLEMTGTVGNFFLLSRLFLPFTKGMFGWEHGGLKNTLGTFLLREGRWSPTGRGRRLRRHRHGPVCSRQKVEVLPGSRDGKQGWQSQEGWQCLVNARRDTWTHQDSSQLMTNLVFSDSWMLLRDKSGSMYTIWNCVFKNLCTCNKQCSFWCSGSDFSSWKLWVLCWHPCFRNSLRVTLWLSGWSWLYLIIKISDHSKKIELVQNGAETGFLLVWVC